MQDKVPTYEKLMEKGCQIPFMCNHCLKHVESYFHIFFECSYAIQILSWFANSINRILQFIEIEDIWNICDLKWSPQCKVVIKYALINLINIIWFAINHKYSMTSLFPRNQQSPWQLQMLLYHVITQPNLLPTQSQVSLFGRL